MVSGCPLPCRLPLHVRCTHSDRGGGVLALNLVGDGLRDFLDPRLRYSA